MKNTTILIFLLTLSNIVSATDYYISANGNDGSNGRSISTPWKTITKVNTSFPSFQPGDKILFNRGDTFYGTLKIAKSGSSGSPITIGAYGTGSNPILTGFTTISGWTNTGGGIYSKVLSCESPPNIVVVNGVNTPMGRYPDSGWLSIDSHSTNISITDAALSSSPDWDGAEVVIRKKHWIMDRNLITNHTGSSISYTSASSNNAIDGYGYFIQKDLGTLTTFGEWYYDAAATKFYMFFGAIDPNSRTVKVSTKDIIISNINYPHYNYILLENLNLQGANKRIVDLMSASNFTIQNCVLQYSGSSGIYGGENGGSNSNYFTIKNSTITDCNNNAVEIGKEFQNALISNNIISNIGTIRGMGGSGDGVHQIGIGISGAYGTIVEYNTLTNIGYIPIVANGSNAKIRNNFIQNFCNVKDDGGGIYTTTSLYTGREITNNIVLYGVGAPAGTTESYGGAHGIYLDDRSSGITVSGNTCAFNALSGIYVHNTINSTIQNNTSFNNEFQISFVHDQHATDYPLRNLTVKGNINFSKKASQLTARINSRTSDFAQFGTFDNNYYARPVDNAKPLFVAINWSGSSKALSEWQNLSTKDPNSKISPILLTDTSHIDFYFNQAQSDKVITLNVPMIDVKGIKYVSSIRLLPYTSAVLMVDPKPAAPTVPVFTGAAIENTSPTILDMTYSISLANIVPPASAFKVTVNSVARTVNTVSISGTKVLLTLASPVVNGNVVTVAYTTPATNQLQTSAGYLAANLSIQSVINNVNSDSRPVYVSSVIENASPNILGMTYNLSLANIVPSASAFKVTVNSVARTVNSVAISGTKVLLTLASPIVSGNVVTVAYTRPSSNPLQSLANWASDNLTAQSVNNNVSAELRPLYVSAVIENGSPNILGMTYDLSLANIVPPASAFKVTVNSVARTVNSVAISGTKVLLTLASPIVSGNVVTVAYTRPSSNLLQSIANWASDNLTAQSVNNNVSAEPRPVYVSAVIESASPNILGMTYNLSLANIVPSASAFKVTVNSVARTVNSVKISGTKVLLTLSSPIVSGNIVTVAYTRPSSNLLQSLAYWASENLTARSVTNRVTAYKSLQIESNEENTSLISPDSKIENSSPTENILIYPNPVIGFVNIKMMEPVLEPMVMIFYDLSGKKCLENRLETGTSDQQIPISLNPGIYYAKIMQGKTTIFTQKLLVIE